MPTYTAGRDLAHRDATGRNAMRRRLGCKWLILWDFHDKTRLAATL
jgi:hypothetical protein